MKGCLFGHRTLAEEKHPIFTTRVQKDQREVSMQHSYLLRVPLIMAGLIILSACSESNAVQRELLLSELREAETNRTMLSEAVRGRRLVLASLEQRLSEQQSGLQAYRDKVESYMMNLCTRQKSARGSERLQAS